MSVLTSLVGAWTMHGKWRPVAAEAGSAAAEAAAEPDLTPWPMQGNSAVKTGKATAGSAAEPNTPRCTADAAADGTGLPPTRSPVPSPPAVAGASQTPLIGRLQAVSA